MKEKSKLFKLKKWFTLSEAVDYLSNSCEENITEKDIFQLALDGHLMLSVNIVNPIVAHVGKVFYQDTTDGDTSNKTCGHEKWDLITTDVNGFCFITLVEGCFFPIHGICDMPLWFENKTVLECKYNELIGSQSPIRLEHGGIVLKGAHDAVYQLQDSIPFEDTDGGLCSAKSSRLPQDSFFVVTKESLTALETILYNDDSTQSSIKNSQKGSNGHLERHAQKREQILGAAFGILATSRTDCLNAKGIVAVSRVASLIHDRAMLFWPEEGKPPLSAEVIAEHLRVWVRQANRK